MRDEEKLKTIINDAYSLIKSNATPDLPAFWGWLTTARLFVERKCEDGGLHKKLFCKIMYAPCSDEKYSSEEMYLKAAKKACARGLFEAIAVLTDYLDELSETIPNNYNVTASDIKQEHQTMPIILDKSKVFIVHGHNGEMKEAIARLIEKQGIEAIILHEQANQGDTTIEKFVRNGDVGAAVCLFTADDVGKANSESSLHMRARQNVVFEAGYFIGRLGRKNVIIIADSGVEIPSDMQGIVYSDSANWQLSVLKELNAIGYNIDYSKLG